MGKLRDLFLGSKGQVEWAHPEFGVARGPQFAVDADSVDPAVFGLTSYASPISPAPRVSRREAVQVPAVKRARDLIAGTLGSLPLDLFDAQRTQIYSPLFAQPEADTPRSVTLTRTIEDLLFEGVAWWRITAFGWDNYPARVRRLEPRSVDVRRDGKVYVSRSGQHQGSADEWVDDRELIRFDSPNDALLVAGARAIRTCLNLEAAAQRFAEGVPPIDYFTPAEGADPAEDEDVTDLLTAWQAARQTRSTAYIPAALQYHTSGWSPEQLQMADARQHCVLEIARIAGIDAEDLGVSTTSRTYFNAFDRRKAFIDFTLGGYRQAVEDRLSMGDVSKRGQYAKFNLSAFLRSDDKTRMETYQIGAAVGAYTTDEIRELEDRRQLAPSELPEPMPQEALMEAAQVEPVETFDTGPAFRFDVPQESAAFEVDVEKRTIKGLAVPYGVVANSGGKRWQFGKGSLKFADVSRVKLWISHDPTQAVGVATELEDTDAGLFASFKVARGAEGDKALSFAEDRVWDGLSIGLGANPKTQLRNGVHHVIEGPLMEISLTPAPSFDDARVHSVAASAAHNEENAMDENETVETATDPVDFSAISDAIAAGFASLSAPQGREVVSAGAPRFEINEGPAYRFDGLPGAHDFSTDLFAHLRDGDAEAGQRVMSFIEEQFTPKFDVSTGDVTTLNPTRHRPDMYVDKLDYTTPLYDRLHKGTLTDNTPFVFPKFSASAGLVAPHVEGVEPTPGSFSATSQTVTPSAVSGKVEVTRETWDAGGSPQVSGLIWNEMVRAYYEALEAQAVAVLDAASPTAIALTAGATDDVLVNELEGKIAELQFIRGGNRFSFMPTHVDLYKALAGAVDGDGRKLLPILNPTNANGSAEPLFSSLVVAGVRATPSWALGASGVVSESSYLLNPADVHLWNSAPKRLTFEWRVAYVDLAIWGYVAAAISRLDGVREITYDPVA